MAVNVVVLGYKLATDRQFLGLLWVGGIGLFLV